MRTFLSLLLLVSAQLAAGPVLHGGDRAGPVSGPAYGTYAWPVSGPVIRPFEAPSNPYSAGHRGIDIAAPFGTPLHAANPGVVSFAGWVGGALFISIDHVDGVRTTYSWLSSVSVKKGQSVQRSQVIGATGRGHPELPQPQLHFGARIGTTYIDPLPLLEPEDVAGLIHLAPVDGTTGPTAPSGAGRWFVACCPQERDPPFRRPP